MVFSSPQQNPDLTKQVASVIRNWKRKERRQHEKNAKKKKLTLEQYVESILLTQSNKTSSLQPKQPVTQTPKPKSHWREFENPNKWKKTLKNGRPLFDIRALKRPDSIIPPKTKITYAMMDWFLRGVGHLDPKDFLDDPDGSIAIHPDLEKYWKSEI